MLLESLMLTIQSCIGHDLGTRGNWKPAWPEQRKLEISCLKFGQVTTVHDYDWFLNVNVLLIYLESFAALLMQVSNLAQNWLSCLRS